MSGTWTPERVELLSSLWADGVPGGVIARRMGLSRGMIAGKRASLGLPPRTGEKAKEAQSANARRTAVICERLGSRADAETQRRKAEQAAALDGLVKPLEGSSPKPWELRRWGECAFPVQGHGAETLSCCEPVERGCAYCFGHKEILAGRPWPPVEPPPGAVHVQWVDA